MYKKALLLGFVATSFAVSAAQAADVILAEPEPVEYVRICDAYGNGFFYIPGTETCINFNGYIRSTYTHYKTTNGGIENPDHASWTYRVRLNVDVRNDTDWGTLRSQFRIQGNGNTSASNGIYLVDRALISVGGFRVGYSNTYWETAHDSAVGSPSIKDGIYYSNKALLVDYTMASNGLAVTFGAQNPSITADDSETPDIYIGAKYSGSWGWLAATYIYDQNGTNAGTAIASGADAWKVSFRLTNMGDTGLNFGAWYTGDGDDATSYVSGAYGAAGALVDYQWGVALDAALTSQITGYVLYSAAESINSSTTYIDTTHLAVGLVWKAVPGLRIQTEYFNNESDYVLAASDTDTDGFIVRMIRSW